MSNEVYGFVDFEALHDESILICNRIESLTGLGCFEIPSDELFGFPPSLIPSEKSVVFTISDKPGCRNATYLVDLIDYAKDAKIGMPLLGKDRLSILVKLITLLFSEFKAKRVVIAVTDSSQIEEVKTVKLDDLFDVLLEDFKEYAPPDVLYEIV